MHPCENSCVCKVKICVLYKHVNAEEHEGHSGCDIPNIQPSQSVGYIQQKTFFFE